MLQKRYKGMTNNFTASNSEKKKYFETAFLSTFFVLKVRFCIKIKL